MKYKKIDYMNKIHDEHTKEMALHPNNIITDLGALVLSTGEVNIISQKNIMCQPDNLIFDFTSGVLYNIEYKCGRKQRNHAQHQLYRTGGHLENFFPRYHIKNLYVHENFKIEEIR